MEKFTFSEKERSEQGAFPTSIDIDRQILSDSEHYYNEAVDKVVDISEEQLQRQEDNKQSIRKRFVIFFSCFLSFQFLALIVLLVLKGAIESFNLSDTLLTTYIVSVFVETLGVVAVMVKFAFDCTQEVKILSTLNDIVSNFQKYSG